MSEVYIRSQNKEKFYMFGNGFNCLGYEKRNGRHVICIGGGVKTTEIIEVRATPQSLTNSWPMPRLP